MITHRFSLEEALGMYEKVLHDPEALGIVIEYPAVHQNQDNNSKEDINNLTHGEVNVSPLFPKSIQTYPQRIPPTVSVPRVGIIGAGNYARSTLLPALNRTKASLAAVADINGVAATHAARKFGGEKSVSDYRLILDDPGIHAVFVLVGHHLHARFVCEALEAGKHIFVEKPLAINEMGLSQVMEAAAKAPDRLLMVGFNRRFSPHVVKIRELLGGRTGPLCMTMTVNAGFIPPEHWTQDPERGGGRIIGRGLSFYRSHVPPGGVSRSNGFRHKGRGKRTPERGLDVHPLKFY